MRTRMNLGRGLAGLGFGGVAALAFAVFLGSAQGQKPDAGGAKPPEKPAATATAPAHTSARADAELDQQINQAKEEIELLEMQLDAKHALLKIGGARLEEAKRWKDRYAGLLREGKVTEERYLAAKDDVLMLEAHLASEKADVRGAELRLKYAKRRLTYGEFGRSPVERRLAEAEQRLADAETKIDLLQHEVGRIRRLQAPESQYNPR